VKNESDNFDIMLQYSDDDGATWTPAIRLNDDTGTNSQGNPAIAVDQTSGDIAISWYDARNDLGDGGPGDTDGAPNDDTQIWATYSTDGGVTFVPNFQVSEGTSNSSVEVTGSSFNFGDYTKLAFDSGTFYPAWSDNSNSAGDNPDGTLHKLDLYTAAARSRSRRDRPPRSPIPVKPAGQGRRFGFTYTVTSEDKAGSGSCRRL